MAAAPVRVQNTATRHCGLTRALADRIEFSEDDESAAATQRTDQTELVEQLRREIDSLKAANAQLQGDCKVRASRIAVCVPLRLIMVRSKRKTKWRRTAPPWSRRRCCWSGPVRR